MEKISRRVEGVGEGDIRSHPLPSMRRVICLYHSDNTNIHVLLGVSAGKRWRSPDAPTRLTTTTRQTALQLHRTQKIISSRTPTVEIVFRQPTTVAGMSYSSSHKSKLSTSISSTTSAMSVSSTSSARSSSQFQTCSCSYTNWPSALQRRSLDRPSSYVSDEDLFGSDEIEYLSDAPAEPRSAAMWAMRAQPLLPPVTKSKRRNSGRSRKSSSTSSAK